MQKKKYVAPRVLNAVPVLMESEILAGSVADKAAVKTMGQEVVTYDFEDSSFNHQWE